MASVVYAVITKARRTLLNSENGFDMPSWSGRAYPRPAISLLASSLQEPNFVQFQPYEWESCSGVDIVPKLFLGG